MSKLVLLMVIRMEGFVKFHDVMHTKKFGIIIADVLYEHLPGIKKTADSAVSFGISANKTRFIDILSERTMKAEKEVHLWIHNGVL